MAVKRLYEREYGLEILVGDPQVQLGDDTILDILDGDLRGGGETGGIENGKLKMEISRSIFASRPIRNWRGI